tara:strand:+ start:1962 stop:2435 length:474 start_codon:yes stop_codon:yes gene_type:complete
MKTIKTLSIALLLLATSFSFAQNGLQDGEAVSASKLKTLFEDAYIDVLDTQDTFIKVKDSKTVYVDVDSKKRFISFNSVYNLQKGVSDKEILELFNKVNKDVIMLKCYYSKEGNTVSFFYYYWIDGGYSNKTVINAFKLFQVGIDLALTKDEKKNIF